MDTGIKSFLEAWGMSETLENFGTSLGLFTSAMGAHLTWTLPFGLLIMFAVFNRFNPAYEEAAQDSVRHHGRHLSTWCSPHRSFGRGRGNVWFYVKLG
jgi:ABC-type Fe3+ transport system permease subunit